MVNVPAVKPRTEMCVFYTFTLFFLDPVQLFSPYFQNMHNICFSFIWTMGSWRQAHDHNLLILSHMLENFHSFSCVSNKKVDQAEIKFEILAALGHWNPISSIKFILLLVLCLNTGSHFIMEKRWYNAVHIWYGNLFIYTLLPPNRRSREFM